MLASRTKQDLEAAHQYCNFILMQNPADMRPEAYLIAELAVERLQELYENRRDEALAPKHP